MLLAKVDIESLPEANLEVTYNKQNVKCNKELLTILSPYFVPIVQGLLEDQDESPLEVSEGIYVLISGLQVKVTAYSSSMIVSNLTAFIKWNPDIINSSNVIALARAAHMTDINVIEIACETYLLKHYLEFPFKDIHILAHELKFKNLLSVLTNQFISQGTLLDFDKTTSFSLCQDLVEHKVPDKKRKRQDIGVENNIFQWKDHPKPGQFTLVQVVKQDEKKVFYRDLYLGKERRELPRKHAESVLVGLGTLKEPHNKTPLVPICKRQHESSSEEFSEEDYVE
jgi:hypothetical protein